MKDPIVPVQPASLLHPEPLVPDKQYYRSVTAVPIEDDSDIQQLLTFVRRRWWVILSVSSLALVGLGARVYLAAPQFEGSFRLLVEPLTNQDAKLDQSLAIATGAISGQKGLDYPSQIEVLKSEVTMTPILEVIHQRYPDLTYGQLVEALSLKNPPNTKLLDVSYKSHDKQQVEFVLNQLSAGFIQYSLLQRFANLKRAVEFVDNQIAEQRREVARLEQWVEKFRRKNDLFEPNEYASSLSSQLTGIIQKRQDNQTQLASAQALSQKLQQQLGLSPSEAVVVSNLSDAPTYQSLLAKLRDVEAQIAVQSAQFLDASPLIQTLKEQRDRLIPLLQKEALRIVNRSEIAKQGTNVQTLGFQGSLGQSLVKQLVDATNQVKILQAQQEALSTVEQDLRSQTKDLAGVARSYGGVQRNLKIANDSLNRLLVAREGLQLDLTKQTDPWQLISTITQTNIHDASGKSRQYTVAAFASLLMGLAAAWVADKLDQAYHNADELSSDLRLPALAQIPLNRRIKNQVSPILLAATETQNPEQSSQLVPRRRRKSAKYGYYNNYYYGLGSFLESFYSLYANIRLMSSDAPIQVVAIVSASPGDGKSTVACHLALAAARMGSRVLLIDADLRWPRLHERFDLPNLRGFSSWLTNDKIPLSLVTQSHPNEENLSFITGGPTPPDPPRLLSSNRLRGLIANLKEEYDLVIFDTPPLGNFVDAKLLASISDGAILVASLEKTDRNRLKDVAHDLRNSINAPLLGCIANGVKNSRLGNSYNQYYNYYGKSHQNEQSLASSSTHPSP